MGLRGKQPVPFEERFFSKVNKLGPVPAHAPHLGNCWEWIGCRTTTGYGQIACGSGPIKAHRVSYEMHCDDIPEGVCVLHKCDNSLCVNPDHLFLGTVDDNQKDMAAKGRGKNGRSGKTHCVHGHEYTLDNTLVWTSKSGKRVRICRTCKARYRHSEKGKKVGREAMRRFRQRKKEST